MNTRNVLPLVLLVSFALAACGELRQEGGKELTGRILLTIERPGSRTLLPADAPVAEFSVEGTGPQGTVLSGVPASATGQFALGNLAPGLWTLTAKGKNGTGLVVASGTVEVSVTSGTTAGCVLALKPVSGQGAFNLQISWPVGRTVETVSGTLTTAAGTAQTVQAPVSGAGATLVLGDLPAGSYLLTLEFRTGGRSVAVPYQDTVLIYTGQLTGGQFSLASADFFPPAAPTFSETAPDDRFALKNAPVSVNGDAKTHYYHFRAPSGYNADKTKAYPLVVYLHSFGPTNVVSSLTDGSPTATPWVLQAFPTSTETPAFVYVPVCPPPYAPTSNLTAPQGGEWNSPEARAMVIGTIEDLQSRFNIDPTRIYLVGFSMGGAGCWYLANEYHRVTGSRFAAVSRGAGWYLAPSGNPPEPPASLAEIQEALSLSPTWIHIGEVEGEGYNVGKYDYDNLKSLYGVPGSEVTVTRSVGNGLNPASGDSLQALFSKQQLTTGVESRLSVYLGHGHEDLMYRNEDLVTWLFSQHL